MAEIPTYRDTIRQIAPWWLRGTLGGRILYAIAITLDVLGDSIHYAIKARFLPESDEGALQASGRERRIQRGRHELSSTYIGRLITWLDSHRQRGGPYGLLAQLFAFWALPASFAINLVYHSGRMFSMAIDGTVTRSDIAWSPPGGGTDWARWWLIYDWPTEFDPDTAWDTSGDWDDGGLWDVDIASMDADTISDIKLVPREWNNAHCLGNVILLSPGAELWDFPAGDWDDPGVWGTSELEALSFTTED